MDVERSLKAITDEDLGVLAKLAAEDRERFYVGRPEYRSRVVCVALCQRAALHYVDMAERASAANGVKDFDVWSFFASVPGHRFPADRRMTHVDLGPSKFGRWTGEPPSFCHFSGRRVDMLMRSLPVELGADPADALADYLREGRTVSARRLAAKAAVLINPIQRRGEIVWPR